jgi:hypothetical protein
MRCRLLFLLVIAGVAAAFAAEPPAPKRVIAALLANGDIPLSVDASCKDVGSEPADRNLRDYVSGLLANFADQKASNSIAVTVKPVTLPGGRAGWQCLIEFVHVPEGDPFRYGVSFQMKIDGIILRRTVRCTGAG